MRQKESRQPGRAQHCRTHSRFQDVRGRGRIISSWDGCNCPSVTSRGGSEGCPAAVAGCMYICSLRRLCSTACTLVKAEQQPGHTPRHDGSQVGGDRKGDHSPLFAKSCPRQQNEVLLLARDLCYFQHCCCWQCLLANNKGPLGGRLIRGTFLVPRRCVPCIPCERPRLKLARQARQGLI